LKNWLILLVLLMIAMGVRYPLISTAAHFYNSDTAILHLMARHLMKGDFALYYWGEHYYGALDWVILAPLFKLFGYSPLVSDLIPFFFSLTFLAMYYQYLLGTTDSQSAVVATLILAVGSYYFLRTTFTTYNYIFTLNFGIAFLLLIRKMSEHLSSRPTAILLGVVMGFSWYYLHLIFIFWAAGFIALLLPYITADHLNRVRERITALTFRGGWEDAILLSHFRCPGWLKRILVLVNLGNLVNFAIAVFLWFHGDWIGFIAGHKVKLFYEPIMASSLQLAALMAVVVYWSAGMTFVRAAAKRFPMAVWISGFVIGYFPALVGYMIGKSPATGGSFTTLADLQINFRVFFLELMQQLFAPDMNEAWGWALLTISLAGIGMLLFEAWTYYQKRRRDQAPASLHPFIALAIMNVLICLFLSKLGNQSTSRYLLPFFITMPLGLAWLLRKIKPRLCALALLGFFLYGNIRLNRMVLAGGERPAPFSGITRYLLDNHFAGGYADYWVSYAITGLADERIILAPLGDIDRYPPYLDYVRSLNTVVILGGDPSPVDSRVVIKGMTYKILKVDSQAGIPFVVAAKIS
jgi:hypothetical protein